MGRSLQGHSHSGPELKQNWRQDLFLNAVLSQTSYKQCCSTTFSTINTTTPSYFFPQFMYYCHDQPFFCFVLTFTSHTQQHARLDILLYFIYFTFFCHISVLFGTLKDHDSPLEGMAQLCVTCRDTEYIFRKFTIKTHNPRPLLHIS